jgi:hypothetical protein
VGCHTHQMYIVTLLYTNWPIWPSGKRKRVQTKNGVAYFKYKDFKKAVVYFKNSLTDVGIGMRVPELEEQDDLGIDYSDEDGVPQKQP